MSHQLMEHSISSSRITSSSSTPTVVGATAGNLREEHEERQRLEKANFDLKMKVYYLEENLKRYQDGEDTSDLRAEQSRSEITSLKLQLEEKNTEVDQRNLLLIKAKSAIEALKSELERLRVESSGKNDLEERVKKLKQQNDDMEADYRAQISQLESQLSTARQNLSTTGHDKTYAEDKLTQLEISFARTNEKLTELQTDKDDVQELWLQGTHKLARQEEELNTCKSHLDMFAQELEEKQSAHDALKAKYKELFILKQKTEEEYKTRIAELNGQYESQIRAMRSNHETELERIREGHIKMLGDIRENYQVEINVAKSQLDKSMLEAKQAEAVDLARVREDYNGRLAEKNDEIKALRGIIEAERVRTNGLLLDLDNTRAELKKKTEYGETISAESALKSEELRAMEALKKELQEVTADCNELVDTLKRTQTELTLKTQRVEELSSTIESAREIIREQEDSLNQYKTELNRVTRECSEFSGKADTVESISRDNERLKAIHTKLQTELLELNHKYSDQRRDLNQATEEVDKLHREIAALKENVSEGKAQCEAVRAIKDDLQSQLQKERERASALDAALAETRTMVSTVRGDLERERSAKLSAEQEVSLTSDQVEELRATLGRACGLAYKAMAEWDEVLSSVLDGDTFRDSHQHQQHQQQSLYGKSGSSGRIGMQSPFHSKKAVASKHQGMRFSLGGVTSSPAVGHRSAGVASHFGADHDDDDELSDILAELESPQLLQNVVVRIERVHLKVERAKKIRSLFEAQAQRLSQTVQAGFQLSQEKCSLLAHRISDAVKETHGVKGVLDRDRKQREDEFSEMKTFREVLLGEHSAQMRDAEVRYNQLAHQLELEKQLSEKERLKNAQLKEEVRALNTTCDELKSDLKNLANTERVVAELSNRATELGEMNRMLVKENEGKSHTVEEISAELNNLKQEKAGLLSNLDKLMNQLRGKDESLLEHEQRINKLLKDIERLRARQINPDLAQSIMDTQSILQSTARARSPVHLEHPHAHFSGAGRDGAATPTPVALFNEQLDQLTELVRTAQDLVQHSAEVFAGFESLVQQRGSSYARSQVMTALERDVAELLELNSKVTIQVHQLSNDLKRAVRRHESKVSVSAAPAVTLRGSDEYRGGGGGGWYEEEHSSRPANGLLSTARRAVSPTHSAAPSEAYLSYTGSRAAPFHSLSVATHRTADSGAAVAAPYLTRSDLSPEKDIDYRRAASPTHYGAAAVAAPRAPLTCASEEYLSSGLKNVFYESQAHIRSSVGSSSSSVAHSGDHRYGYGGYRTASEVDSYSAGAVAAPSTTKVWSSDIGTPNTASRASVSRLNKLGNDLSLLAKKLDSFDSSNKTKAQK